MKRKAWVAIWLYDLEKHRNNKLLFLKKKNNNKTSNLNEANQDNLNFAYDFRVHLYFM